MIFFFSQCNSPLGMISIYSDALDKTPHNLSDFPVAKMGYPNRKGSGTYIDYNACNLGFLTFSPDFLLSAIPDRVNGAIKGSSWQRLEYQSLPGMEDSNRTHDKNSPPVLLDPFE